MADHIAFTGKRIETGSFLKHVNVLPVIRIDRDCGMSAVVKTKESLRKQHRSSKEFDPGGLIEAAVQSDQVLVLGQRPETLRSRRCPGGVVHRQPSLFVLT
jgi:hypothetical protein